MPGLFRLDDTLLDKYISDLKGARLTDSEKESLDGVESLLSGKMDDRLHKLLVEWGVGSEFGHIDQFRSRGRSEDSVVRFIHDGTERIFRAGTESVTWDGPFMDLPNAIYYDTPFIIDEAIAPSVRPTHRGRLSSILRNEGNSSLLEQMITDSRLDDFERAVERIVPGRITYDPKDGSMQYRENGSEPIDAKNLAAGMKVFSIMRMLIESGRINQDTVVMMDEPEIHLHPAWQVTLASMIMALRRGVGCRILLTTHSPLLLRAIEAYSDIESERVRYYLMERDGAGSLVCIDMHDDPERAYRSMADAYDLVENLYYRDDEDDVGRRAEGSLQTQRSLREGHGQEVQVRAGGGYRLFGFRWNGRAPRRRRQAVQYGRHHRG